MASKMVNVTAKQWAKVSDVDCTVQYVKDVSGTDRKVYLLQDTSMPTSPLTIDDSYRSKVVDLYEVAAVVGLDGDVLYAYCSADAILSVD